MRKAADAILAAAVLVLHVGVLPAIGEVLDVATLLAMVVFALVGLAVGHFVGGAGTRQRGSDPWA